MSSSQCLKCGVAVLSCTDCSGSSTASSDITDPGSPFSTASSHSEDSGSQPPKMPPTQTAHHPPWPWTAEEGPPLKRTLPEKTAFSKRLKSTEEFTNKKQSPSCLNNTVQNTKTPVQLVKDTSNTDTSPNDKLVNINNNCLKAKKVDLMQQQQQPQQPKMQQGKITEYFKSQMKGNSLKKDFTNLVNKTSSDIKRNNTLNNNKFVSLVDQQQQISNVKIQSTVTRKEVIKSVSQTMKKVIVDTRTRKLSAVSVHRKILPAPCKAADKNAINNHHTLPNFPPTVTLTAVSFPPNVTYLHAKTPAKPADNIFFPQIAPITNDKLNISIVNRTPYLNVIQQVPKLTTINNYNCVKLNATVVPVVKINTLPSRLSGAAAANLANVALSVETAVPTVLSAKAKLNESSIIAGKTATIAVTNQVTPKQQQYVNATHNNANNLSTVVEKNVQIKIRTEDKSRTVVDACGAQECSKLPDKCRREEISLRIQQEKSPSPDSDSGISIKECLEVSVSETAVVSVEQQKSPILSQPKTIRFPAKEDHKRKEESRRKELKSSQSADGLCRWADCTAHFDTSGALLEHLQVKHVISQASQEQYVCLWLGCKVHGRTSCSRSWLERHVLAHAGTKPFRCIVDGCGQRFNSQLMLERHVNGHFNTDGSQTNNTKKTTDNGPIKQFKRNGKRIRFRRQPWSARMFDFIDSGIMEGLQHKLLQMTQNRTLGRIHNSGDTVNLQSQVMARRTEPDGSTKFLVRWFPLDVIADEWVSEKEYCETKTVSIPRLQPSSKDALKPSLFPANPDVNTRQKHRRKPISKRQT